MIAEFKKTAPWPTLAMTLVIPLGLVTLTDAHTKKGVEKLLEESAIQKSDKAEALSADSERVQARPVEKKFDVIRVEGSERSYRLSPEGERIAYIDATSGTEHLYIMNLKTRTVVNVTKNLFTRTNNVFWLDTWLWSPKGDEIVFVDGVAETGRSTNQTYTLRSVSAAGGLIRSLFENKSWFRPVGWSPEGDIIVLSWLPPGKYDRLQLLSPKNGQHKVLLDLDLSGTFFQTLSPDAKAVAAVRRKDGRLIVTELSNTREHEIGPFVFPEPGVVTPSFCWTSDSRHLLFQAPNRRELYAQSIRDGVPNAAPILIKKDIGDARALQVLQDGRLLFRKGDPLRRQSYYRVSVDLNTGQTVGSPTRVADALYGGAGTLSPDGRRLAIPYALFSGLFGDGRTVLNVLLIDGKVERDISVNLRGALPQAWFPDGKCLMVQAMKGIFRVDIATGHAQSLFSVSAANTNGPRGGGYVTHYPAMSRDGRKIAFVMPIDYETKQEGRRALFVINAEPGAKPILVRNEPDEGVGWPDWSPDGRSIGFMGRNPETKILRILVMPASGSEVRELARHENEVPPSSGVWGTLSGGLAWSPNGKYIYYTRVQEGDGAPALRKEVWRVNTQDGDKVRMGELDGYDARHFQISSDGRALFFVGRVSLERSPAQPVEFFTWENFLPAQKTTAK